MSTIYTTTQRGQKITAICHSENTRSGFRHIVELQTENGGEIARAKVCYINRTWEVYNYQTALHKAIAAARLSANKAEDEKLKAALVRQFDRIGCPSVYKRRGA